MTIGNTFPKLKNNNEALTNFQITVHKKEIKINCNF